MFFSHILMGFLFAIKIILYHLMVNKSIQNKQEVCSVWVLAWETLLFVRHHLEKDKDIMFYQVNLGIVIHLGSTKHPSNT